MNFTEVELLNRSFLSLALGTLVRSAILAGVCGALALLLRSKTAEIRHWLWHGMLFALLLLPILQIAAPPLRRGCGPVCNVEAVVLPTMQAGNITENLSGETTMAALPAEQSDHSPGWILVTLFFYAAVTFALLFRLAASLLRLTGILRRSKFIDSEDLRELAHQVWLESGALVKPRVRVSDEVSVPVAADLDEFFILLPDSWRRWDRVKVRAVMVHEMAHVKRNDPATTLLASLATCVFWFHPLAWFLKRQLALLAEEASDESALESVAAPEQYAQILVDFTRDAAGTGGRVLQPASAVVRDSQIKRRMKRIFAGSRFDKKGLSAVRLLLIAILVPGVYVTAAARFENPQDTDSANSALLIQDWPKSGVLLTSDQVFQLEKQLEAEPEDLEARAKLLSYYMQHVEAADFMRHLLWVIEHHPESQILDWPMGLLSPDGGPVNTAADYQTVRAAWEQQLTNHPDSAEVLCHAGKFFERTDGDRAAELFQRAHGLDPSNNACFRALAMVYETAVLSDLQFADPASRRVFAIHLSPDNASELRTDLLNSTDPVLLSDVGTALVRMSQHPPDNPHKEMGFQLIEQAISLDPANPKWKEALESAKAEPVWQTEVRETSKTPRPAGVIRIGAKVAEANLLEKVEPQYPPLALQARIQGTVEFTVTIGPDGHIQNLRLERGHPLLVNAAKEAVLQWRYRPTLLNGQPVSVMTDVSVTFQLP